MRTLLVLLLALCSTASSFAQSTTTLFTFQGRLDDSGAPANGAHDIRVTPYGAVSGGSALGPPVCADDVPVVDGLFTMQLPTTLAAAGTDLFLSIEVRADPTAATTCGSPLGFTAISPRMAVTPAPTAAYSLAIAAQSPERPGAVRFDATTRTFEGFDGAFWVPLQVGTPAAPANNQIFSTPGSQPFIVPAGVTWLGADVWGGGGGGGGFAGGGTAATGCPLPALHKGGGGGGASGAFGRAGFAVTPGETLTIIVGQGGNGANMGGTGTTGTTTRVRRGITDLVIANGGAGGFPGTSHSATSTPVLSGPGGTGGTATAPAPSVLISSQTGGTGGLGFSAACGGFPTTFTPPTAGGGASARTGGSPLANHAAGAGGPGSATTTTATSGLPGAVRLFWN